MLRSTKWRCLLLLIYSAIVTSCEERDIDTCPYKSINSAVNHSNLILLCALEEKRDIGSYSDVSFKEGCFKILKVLYGNYSKKTIALPYGYGKMAIPPAINDKIIVFANHNSGKSVVKIIIATEKNILATSKAIQELNTQCAKMPQGGTAKGADPFEK